MCVKKKSVRKLNGWQVYFSQGDAAGSLHVDLFESIIKVSTAGHRQISSERWKAEMEIPVPFLSRVGDRKILDFPVDFRRYFHKPEDRCRCIASELSLMDEKKHQQTAVRNIFTIKYTFLD